MEDKEVVRQRAATWWSINKDSANLRRNAQKFGITPEEYAELALAEHCYICLGPPDGRWTKLNLDHDHATGKIRKMLCGKCNKTLGLVNDSEALLGQMIDYLKEHNAQE